MATEVEHIDGEDLETPAAPGPNDGEYASEDAAQAKTAVVRKKTDVTALRVELARLPAKKRLQAIMDCDDVMRVVRSLPAQDLFLTLKEVGPSEALEVVELLHPRQVQAFMDLDGWRKDRIDGEGVGAWLEILYAANPERAVRQILGLDLELLSLLFKMYTRAFEIEEGEELPVELDHPLTSVTPDQRYVLVYGPAPGRERLLQALRTTVERLFGINLPFVLHLIQAVRWELPSALEEEALRFRNARLADLGFGDVSEPAALFAYENPDAADPGAAHAVSEPEEAGEDGDIDPESPPLDLSRSVFVPWSLLDAGEHVLGGAVRPLPARATDRVAHELGQVINRLHLANGGDLGDPGALQDSAIRAADTIGLALAYRAKGDQQAATRLLSTTPLLTLFRMGHALATRLSKTLREQMANSDGGLSGEGILRLDPPLREVSAGLLLARPLFFRGLTEPARTDYRHFSSLPELAYTARALSEGAIRAGFLKGAPLRVDDAFIAGCGVTDSAAQPSHSALLGSAIARCILDAEPSCTPLSTPLLHALAECLEGEIGHKAFSSAQRKRVVAFVDAQLESAKEALPKADDVAERAHAWADRVLATIAEELGALREAPQAELVQSVWTHAALAVANGTPAATPAADAAEEASESDEDA